MFAGIRIMFLTKILLCLLPGLACGTSTARPAAAILLDMRHPKAQSHLDALVRIAQSCVVKVQASRQDVEAYFRNAAPMTKPGKCFAACMLEETDVINNGMVNREILAHQVIEVYGKNSNVVRKLKRVSIMCLSHIEGLSDHCQLGSAYIDCLNSNLMEFAFPYYFAGEAVRKMPFHLIKPKPRGTTRKLRREWIKI